MSDRASRLFVAVNGNRCGSTGRAGEVSGDRRVTREVAHERSSLASQLASCARSVAVVGAERDANAQRVVQGAASHRHSLPRSSEAQQ